MDEIMEYLEKHGLGFHITEEPEILFEVSKWLNKPPSADKMKDLIFLLRNGVRLEIIDIEKMKDVLGYAEIFECLPDLFKSTISINFNLLAKNKREFSISFFTDTEFGLLGERVAMDMKKNPEQYGISKNKQQLRGIFETEEDVKKKTKKELDKFYGVLTKGFYTKELDVLCDGLHKVIVEGNSKRTEFEKIVKKEMLIRSIPMGIER